MRDYRSILEAHAVPRLGAERIEDITPAMIETSRASFAPHLAARTKNKWLVVLHGIYRRAQTVWGAADRPGDRHRGLAEPLRLTSRWKAFAAQRRQLEAFSETSDEGPRFRDELANPLILKRRLMGV